MLQVKTQGVRGLSVKTEKKGYVSAIFDSGHITVDMFEGSGTKYRERINEQIIIFSNEVGECFVGSLKELIKKIRS